MHRGARGLFLYVILSVAAVPLHRLWSLPHIPSKALGWLAFLAIPIPLAVACDWLFKYRPLQAFQRIDAWATRVEQSPYRLPIVAGLVIVTGSVGFALLALRA